MVNEEYFRRIILILCIFNLLELFTMGLNSLFLFKTSKLTKMKMWKYQFIKGQFDEVIPSLFRYNICILYIPKTSLL